MSCQYRPRYEYRIERHRKIKQEGKALVDAEVKARNEKSRIIITMEVSGEEEDIRSIKRKRIAIKKESRAKNIPQAERRLSFFKQNSTLLLPKERENPLPC